jgi:photosystem II stability/assembly factor-like uncharacterized protein
MVQTWTTRTSNFGYATIRSVAYGNNLWALGGDSGTLRTSTDAVTWTTRTSNFGNARILSLAYGNNLWVAGGYNGTLRTSTDATTWTTQTSNFGTSTNTNSVAYGNNVWVAGGFSGTLRTENSTDRQLVLSATVTNAYLTGSEVTAILEKTEAIA